MTTHASQISTGLRGWFAAVVVALFTLALLGGNTFAAEHGKADAGPHDRANAAAGLVDQIAELGTMMIGRQAGADVGHLASGFGAAEQLGQDGMGAIVLPARDQIARAFGNDEEGEEVDGGGNGLKPEHPAQGGKAHPQIRGRTTGIAGEHEIGDEGAGETGDDHHLLDRGEPAAHGGDFQRRQLAPQRGDGWRKRAVVEDALLLCADASASWERAVGLGEDRPPSGGARCTQSG